MEGERTLASIRVRTPIPVCLMLVAHGTMRRMVAARDSITQLRRGVVEHCLLALLLDNELYGFEVARVMSAAGLVAGEGTVYPLLSRLAREGYVTTTWRESPSGPPRKYYAITEQGRAALDHFRLEWRRFRDRVDALLDGGNEA